MAASGMVAVGSHTHTHRVLAHADAHVATDEICRSLGLIEHLPQSGSR